MNSDTNADQEAPLVECKRTPIGWPACALSTGVFRLESATAGTGSPRRQWRWQTLLSNTTSVAAFLLAAVALAVVVADRAELAELRALAVSSARSPQGDWYRDQIDKLSFLVSSSFIFVIYEYTSDFHNILQLLNPFYTKQC